MQKCGYDWIYELKTTQGGVFIFHNTSPIKRRNRTVRRITTTRKINEAITNNLLQITKAEVYYKTSGKTEAIDAATFRENFSFLCESGIFTDSIGWHCERNIKVSNYIVETGRMNPDTEIIISVYLSVCVGVNVEDIERTLLFEEE